MRSDCSVVHPATMILVQDLLACRPLLEQAVPDAFAVLHLRLPWPSDHDAVDTAHSMMYLELLNQRQMKGDYVALVLLETFCLRYVSEAQHIWFSRPLPI